MALRGSLTNTYGVTLNDIAKAAPPMGVAGMKLFGVLLSDWIIILTVIYTLFLIIDKADAVCVKIAAWLRRLRKWHDEKGE
jgi:hypothetical protein